MDAGTWISTDGTRADASAPDQSPVRWRRRGASTELRFDEPAGRPLWRRQLVPTGAIPAFRAIGWWFTAGVAHVTATTGVAVTLLATGAELWPAWLVGLLGMAVPPAAGVVGYSSGRRRQSHAVERAAVLDGIGDASTAAIGSDFRGRTGKPLALGIADAMRAGEARDVRVWTGGVFERYRIQPRDATTVTITPLDAPPEVLAARRVARFVAPTSGVRRVTADADRRMAALERRLDAIERAGRIDSSHPSYPAFVILQVDRITEYHHLAAQANAIATLDTPEARTTAQSLADDLEHVIDLTAVGVDELERDVLAGSRRSSEEQLQFLRDKYAGSPAADAARGSAL